MSSKLFSEYSQYPLKPLYKFSGLVELMHSTDMVSEIELCLQDQPTQNVSV